MSIEGEVADYLAESASRFVRGSDEYYARLALRAALDAFLRGDYAVGAVAVLVKGSLVSEFAEGNAMLSGGGVIDHAELRALMRLAAGATPDSRYRSELPLPQGLTVFGTLEPCPMCVCGLANAGAVRSVCTVEDGVLVEAGGFRLSDGGANVLGQKRFTQPAVWSRIFEARGVKFELLETEDESLRSLTRDLFAATRGSLDEVLVHRGPVGG